MIRKISQSLIVLFLPLMLEAQSFTSSNLPIIIIDTYGITIPDEPKIPGTMKIVDNGPGQTNYIWNPGNIYNGNIGIEVRGASSASYPQKPYAVETRDVQQNELNVSLFGFPEEHDWVLLANYNDKVFMRNTLAFRLAQQTGHYASRTRYAEVVVNGEYEGIYIFGEKIKRDNGRVDIAKLLPNENSGEHMTGGYIFKIDYWDWTNSWMSFYHPPGHPDFDVHYVYYYPKPDDISESQKEYIQSYVNSFESVLYGLGFADTVNGYRKYIDAGSFLDYFLVNEVSRNNDGFKKSWYFFKDRDSIDRRINAGPVWDFDWAWKNIDECFIFSNTDGSGWAYKVNDCYPDVNSPGWHIRLLQDPLFRNELKCRYEFLRGNILNTDTLLNWVDANVQYLWEAQTRHYVRWPILGLNVGAPVVGDIPETFQGEIDGFKNWITLRLNWLDANMPGICTHTKLPDFAKTASLPFIFPNPADDLAFLEYPSGNSDLQLIITDMTGRVIPAKLNYEDQIYSIDTHSLPAGMYICRVLNNMKHAEHKLKLIIER
jgi:hypothetical protein